mmetsp:Transcript_30690/g.57465  ORF Transcript_30690/g.57465 Transcript_30690/m.57465 type:complete len:110 (+) Transcript_30690:914-1243(+)
MRSSRYRYPCRPSYERIPAESSDDDTTEKGSVESNDNDHIRTTGDSSFHSSSHHTPLDCILSNVSVKDDFGDNCSTCRFRPRLLLQPHDLAQRKLVVSPCEQEFRSLDS